MEEDDGDDDDDDDKDKKSGQTSRKSLILLEMGFGFIERMKTQEKRGRKKQINTHTLYFL